MKVKKYSILLGLLLPLYVWAGRIEADYGDYTIRKYYIGYYRQGNWQLADSVEVNVSGRFIRNLPDTLKGIVIMVAADDRTPATAFRNLTNENSLQFVYEGQDISYTTSWRNNSGYIKYGKGCQATAVLKALDSTLTRVQEHIYYIQKLIETTPGKDEFFTALYKGYAAEVKRFNSYCDSVAATFPMQSYMAVYARMFKQACPPKDVIKQNLTIWMAAHVFDYTNLHNALTADVPLFRGMLKYYFYISHPPGLVPEEKIKSSKETARQKLLEKSSGAAREMIRTFEG